MSTYRHIAIETVSTGNRLRDLDPAWVAYLAEEIANDGQIEPIRVVARADRYELVDGARRIAALIKLGTTEVEAKVEPETALADDGAVRIAEIKAHLLRGALTALEQSVCIATWCEIYKERFGSPKRGPKPKTHEEPTETELSATLGTNWTDAAQTALGLSRRSLFRALKIGSLDALLRRRISALPVANNQAELLLLADQTPMRQAALVELIAGDDPKASTIAEAIALFDAVPAPKRVPIHERMQERFSRLDRRDQERFFDLNRDAIDAWLSKRTIARAA